jgi:pyridoxamine 5'-phosphate oxidase
MSLSPAQLAALRQEYSLRSLHRADLLADATEQFRAWLHEAHEKDLLEPNAMTLGTVDAEGQPWTRTVLLKGVDERGFVFFTNYEGAKGRHMAANPRVALTFWWGGLERQVNITGTISRTSREESESYFHSRPESSQLGAWASAQSTVVESRETLEQRFAEARSRFDEGEIPLPDFWGGYIVAPLTVEFWQGQRSRLHDRLRYTRAGTNGWTIERLSP